jgi:hypothetical protein
MINPTDIKALSDYRLLVRYEDGSKGEIDLSHLAGRGVFALWDDYTNFENVKIADDGAIFWSEDVELCPYATYLKFTGKSPEDIFPKLKPAANA